MQSVPPLLRLACPFPALPGCVLLWQLLCVRTFDRTGERQMSLLGPSLANECIDLNGAPLGQGRCRSRNRSRRRCNLKERSVTAVDK